MVYLDQHWWYSFLQLLRKMCQNTGFLWPVFYKIRENTGQRKPVFWRMFYAVYLELTRLLQMQLFSTPWRKSELGTNGLILMFQDPVKIKSARFLKSCKVFDALDIFFSFYGHSGRPVAKISNSNLRSRSTFAHVTYFIY